MTSTTSTTTVGVFETRGQAQQAVAELNRMGFNDEQIGMVAKDESTAKTGLKDDPTNTRWEEGTGIGAAAGAVTGTGLGLAVAAGLLTPIGPLIAGGADHLHRQHRGRCHRRHPGGRVGRPRRLRGRRHLLRERSQRRPVRGDRVRWEPGFRSQGNVHAVQRVRPQHGCRAEQFFAQRVVVI